VNDEAPTIRFTPDGLGKQRGLGEVLRPRASVVRVQLLSFCEHLRMAGWASRGQRQTPGAAAFSVAAVGLVAATIAAWVALIATNDGDSMEMMPSAGAYLGSWTVMMAAMMLPSVAPFALLFARGVTNAAAPGFLAAGYLGVWALVGIPAYALDRALGMDHPTATAAVLVAAGLYQLSPLKDACLRRCRTPGDFLVQHWHPGLGGAFRLGAEHGTFCLGCCIALMAVLVVAGGMGLAWVAAIAVVVAAEKLLPRGRLIARLGGIALVTAGIVVAL
jgi:predicted metal-binding membrane protein